MFDIYYSVYFFAELKNIGLLTLHLIRTDGSPLRFLTYIESQDAPKYKIKLTLKIIQNLNKPCLNECRFLFNWNKKSRYTLALKTVFEDEYHILESGTELALISKKAKNSLNSI